MAEFEAVYTQIRPMGKLWLIPSYMRNEDVTLCVGVDKMSV